MRKTILTLLFVSILPTALFAGFSFGLIKEVKKKVDKVDEKVSQRIIASVATSPDTQAPTVPTNLTATAVNSSQINLSWTASTDNVGVTSYNIYRDGGTSPIITQTGTTYNDIYLTVSTVYSYTVSACDAVGNCSAQSTAANATTAAPAFCTVQGVTTNGDVVYCDSSLKMWSPTMDTTSWDIASGYLCMGVCESLIYAGHTDWVLPSCISGTEGTGCQLYAFGMDACGWTSAGWPQSPCTPAWDTNAYTGSYWSSTAYSTTHAYIVYFDDGPVNAYSKTGFSSVRCVRASPTVINSSPTLSWTGESNYTTDGIDPETGTTATSFIYRVKYADVDNDTPALGYPKLHIKKSGAEISGSPFAMIFISSTTYIAGAIYSYSRVLTSTGTDYTYYFEAHDSSGAVASGVPTLSVDAPDVANPAPATALNPSFGSIYTSSMTAAWTAIPGANYTAVVALNSGYTSIVSSGSLSGNTTTFAGLSANTSYYFQVKLSTETDAAYIINRISTKTNALPTLTWTGESNYTADGINPETGASTTTFVYRVKYTDADNDAPASGYPKVHISTAGGEISGSPFAMTAADSNAFTTGRKYTYSKTLSEGSDYTYYFEAQDAYGAIAAGTPTSPKDSPDVDYTWSSSIADSTNDVDLENTAPSLALDLNGYPHIVYGGTCIRHVEPTQLPPTDTDWVKTDVACYNSYPHMAFGTDNSVHVVYKSNNYTKKISGQSSFSTPISLGGSSGDYESAITLDSGNKPYVAYTYSWDSVWPYYNGVIRCVRWNGTSWVSMPDVSTAGKSPSIAVGPNGYPHIAYSYTDANGTYLKYTKWNGSSWTTPIQLDYGSSPSIKVDSNNYPHIAYGSKYIESWDGSSWTTPQTTPSGGTPSLVLDSNANPHIAYLSAVGVSYAKRIAPLTSWASQIAIADSTLPLVSYNKMSLALDSNGKPRITAVEMYSRDLVYMWAQ